MPGNSFSHDRRTYGWSSAISQTSAALNHFWVIFAPQYSKVHEVRFREPPERRPLEPLERLEPLEPSELFERFSRLARTWIRIGVPSKPNSSRSRFSRYR